MTNFFEADFALDESVIQEQAEVKAKEMIKEMTKEPESGLTVVVKKKEAIPDRSPQRVVVTALIEYPDVPKTMDVF